LFTTPAVVEQPLRITILITAMLGRRIEGHFPYSGVVVRSSDAAGGGAAGDVVEREFRSLLRVLLLLFRLLFRLSGVAVGAGGAAWPWIWVPSCRTPALALAPSR